LKREARIPSISLNKSVIRMRAYAVRLLRLDESNFRYTGAAETSLRAYRPPIGTLSPSPRESAKSSPRSSLRLSGVSSGISAKPECLVLPDQNAERAMIYLGTAQRAEKQFTRRCQPGQIICG
jgi:hypothetical protein